MDFVVFSCLLALLASIAVCGPSPYKVTKHNSVIYNFDSQGRNIDLQYMLPASPMIWSPYVSLQPQFISPPVQKLQIANRFVPNIDPEKCHADSFCEDDDSYPYQEVDQKLAEAGENFEYLFGTDPMDVTNKMDTSMFSNADVETPGQAEFRETCDTTQRIIFPRIAKNKRSEWKFVVNQESRKVQGIAVEWCKSSGDRCDYLTSLHKNIIPTCGMKYAFRRLLAFSHEGLLEADIFEFPVACVCYAKVLKAKKQH